MPANDAEATSDRAQAAKRLFVVRRGTRADVASSPLSIGKKELGRTGIHLPEIALGTWKYTAGAEVLRKAIDLGASFIDTAEMYGNEDVLGVAAQGIRERVFIATKVSPGHFRRRDLIEAADRSLQKLRTDHIDLYQLHAPDAAVPIEETMGAMEDLVDAGKVRFIGVSNFRLAQLRSAEAALRRHRIVSNQMQYSLIDRAIERELLAYCRQHGITILAYSPLGSGLDSLRSKRGAATLRAIAAELSKTEAQVALNWCISHEGVVAITKSNSLERIVENCNASGWRLSDRHMQILNDAFGLPRPFEMAVRRTARTALQVLRRER